MSRIIKVEVRLKGEKEPQQHYALVFDDVTELSGFMVYRNVLTTAAKMLSSEHGSEFESEIFHLIQLSEFISTALDFELYWKGGNNGQDHSYVLA